MKKYYLDTCIWRDYLEDRKDKFRPLGEWAFQLIKKMIEEESYFLISKLVIQEMKKYYPQNRIDSLFNIIPQRLLIFAEYQVDLVREAHNLGRKHCIPAGDALHFLIAQENNAVLITRDKHFESFKDKIQIFQPEELI